MFPLFFLTHPPQNNPDQAGFFSFSFSWRWSPKRCRSSWPARPPPPGLAREHPGAYYHTNDARTPNVGIRYYDAMHAKTLIKKRKRKKGRKRKDKSGGDTSSRGEQIPRNSGAHYYYYYYNHTNHFWCRFGTYVLFFFFFFLVNRYDIQCRELYKHLTYIEK